MTNITYFTHTTKKSVQMISDATPNAACAPAMLTAN